MKFKSRAFYFSILYCFMLLPLRFAQARCEGSESFSVQSKLLYYHKGWRVSYTWNEKKNCEPWTPSTIIHYRLKTFFFNPHASRSIQTVLSKFIIFWREKKVEKAGMDYNPNLLLEWMRVNCERQFSLLKWTFKRNVSSLLCKQSLLLSSLIEFAKFLVSEKKLCWQGVF